MRLSLNISINLILLFVVVALGSTIGAFFHAEQKQALRQDLEHRVTAIGEQVAEQVARPLTEGDLDQVGRILGSAALAPEVAFVMVKSPEGEVVAARWMSSVAGGVREYHFPIHSPQIGKARADATFGTVTTIPPGAEIASVAVGTDLGPLQNAQQRLLVRTVLAILLGSFASIILGLSIVNRLLHRSFTPLMKGIREISSGDFSRRVSPDPHREIAEIACAFNEMAERFSTTLVSKQELEATVARRTAELQHALEDQTRVRKALAEREEHIRLLFNSTAEAIAAIDLDGICTFCNPACLKLLGYDSTDQVVGMKLHQLIGHSAVDGSPINQSDCTITGMLRTGQGFHCSNEIFRKRDGSLFPVEYWSHPLLREGEIVGAVVTFLDMSERTMLQKQLLQAQKLEGIGVLAGGIAHDFNNLLTAIIGGAGLAQADMEEGSRGARAIAAVMEAADRAAGLTRQILAFSRKQVLSIKELNLNDEVLSEMKMLRRLISEDIRVQLNLSPEKLYITADATQLQQVLLNLAVNARDAMDPGGTLTIETSAIALERSERWIEEQMPPGRYAILSVSDTGAGMDEEVRAHIFEPFFTTKPPGQGTGLGLSTVHGIIKQHQGTITVYSEPGRGTTFRVYLPCTDSRQNLEQAPSQQVLPRGEGAILVVEDEDAVRTFLEGALLQNGFRVTGVATGGEAVEALGRERFDLLVTDVVMPGMNGAKVYAAARELQPGMKVLFISGYPARSGSLENILDPAEPFLPKPFSINTLLAKVHEVMEAGRTAG